MIEIEQQKEVDINSLFNRGAERRIKIYPCYVNRASQIGHPCERKLFYDRTRWADAMKYDVGLQCVFDVGNLFESYVKNKLKEDGFELSEDQRPFEDKELKLSGKLDTKIKHSELDGKWHIAEIKSMSANIFPAINNSEDFLNHKSHYIRGYIDQIQLYLYLSSLDKQAFEEFGYIILCNKTSGQLKAIKIFLNLDYVESILQKAKKINDYVNADITPDAEYEDSVCTKCPYRHFCDVCANHGEGAGLLLDEDLKYELIERENLKESFKRYEELDELVKFKIKDYSTKENKDLFILDEFEIVLKARKYPSYEIPKDIKESYKTMKESKVITIKNAKRN